MLWFIFHLACAFRAIFLNKKVHFAVLKKKKSSKVIENERGDFRKQEDSSKGGKHHQKKPHNSLLKWIGVSEI